MKSIPLPHAVELLSSDANENVKEVLKEATLSLSL